VCAALCSVKRFRRVQLPTRNPVHLTTMRRIDIKLLDNGYERSKIILLTVDSQPTSHLLNYRHVSPESRVILETMG